MLLGMDDLFVATASLSGCALPILLGILLAACLADRYLESRKRAKDALSELCLNPEEFVTRGDLAIMTQGQAKIEKRLDERLDDVERTVGAELKGIHRSLGRIEGKLDKA